ncbi:hypothetical protein, partial [Moellerella wisconsensis]|uniref:hypothetical protein n=1 Tax=Moellerella wisconsensis TaxID=158849 RepID=UPI0030765075
MIYSLIHIDTINLYIYWFSLKGDICGFGGAIGAGGDLTDTGEGVGQRGYGGAEIVSVDRVGYYRCTV